MKLAYFALSFAVLAFVLSITGLMLKFATIADLNDEVDMLTQERDSALALATTTQLQHDACRAGYSAIRDTNLIAADLISDNTAYYTLIGETQTLRDYIAAYTIANVKYREYVEVLE